jgi:hypothetical protein
MATGAFDRLAAKLAARGARDPKALAAWIGRKQLGKAEFQRRAAAGRRKTNS